MIFHKEVLRDRRIYAGFSQEEFAARVGVCKQAVQKWEKGIAVPREKRLRKIAEVLNAKIAEFSDINITGSGNCVASHNNFLPATDDGTAVERFRSGLIDQFIDSDLSPDALKTALQIIKNYKSKM